MFSLTFYVTPRDPVGLARFNPKTKAMTMNISVAMASQITDATPVHNAISLTEGGAQARIVLNGQVYSLRITRAGKLILTK